jgi:TRAP-type C4-dicarboxylate transport system permease small subunit
VYYKVLEKIVLSLLVMMLIGTMVLIVGRYIPFIKEFSWGLEIVEFSMIWMVFIGASIAIKDRGHFFVDLVPEKYENSIGMVLNILYVLVILLFCYIYIVYGYVYFTNWSLIQISEILQINLGFVYFSVPFCGINSLIFLFAEMVEKKINSKEVGND